jgi:hypothetical protein
MVELQHKKHQAISVSEGAKNGSIFVSDNTTDDCRRTMDEFSKTLQGEEPKIVNGVKVRHLFILPSQLSCHHAQNFISKIVGEDLTRNESSTKADKITFTFMDAQMIARQLLKHINALELQSAPQWGLVHPQLPEQSGSDRMTQIAQYKVVYSLLQQVRTHANARPTSMLGRTWLSIVFPEIQKVFAQENSVSSVADEIVTEFMRQFSLSLPNGEEQDSELAELVWANDFKAVLQQRQEQRKDAAVRRLAEAAEEEKQQLAEAMAAAKEENELPRDQQQGQTDLQAQQPQSFAGAKVEVEDLGNGNTRTIFTPGSNKT